MAGVAAAPGGRGRPCTSSVEAPRCLRRVGGSRGGASDGGWGSQGGGGSGVSPVTWLGPFCLLFPSPRPPPPCSMARFPCHSPPPPPSPVFAPAAWRVTWAARPPSSLLPLTPRAGVPLPLPPKTDITLPPPLSPFLAFPSPPPCRRRRLNSCRLRRPIRRRPTRRHPRPAGGSRASGSCGSHTGACAPPAYSASGGRCEGAGGAGPGPPVPRPIAWAHHEGAADPAGVAAAPSLGRRWPGQCLFPLWVQQGRGGTAAFTLFPLGRSRRCWRRRGPAAAAPTVPTYIAPWGVEGGESRQRPPKPATLSAFHATRRRGRQGRGRPVAPEPLRGAARQCTHPPLPFCPLCPPPHHPPLPLLGPASSRLKGGEHAGAPAGSRRRPETPPRPSHLPATAPPAPAEAAHA